jgi:uncharacterized membrane protein YraQ (UPF0718 family)
MDAARSARKTCRMFLHTLPLLAGILLLISLAQVLIPPAAYAAVFTGNFLLDPVIGAAFGSIAAGNPITSYIIGGELLQLGVGTTAVTAFIISWVTVGLIHLPAEMGILGRRFALARNLIAFLLSILIAVLVTITLWLLEGGS